MVTYEIEYFDGKSKLRGYVARPEDINENTPVILIAHMWAGRVPFVNEKAKEFAKKGYIGFAIDMYGEGVIGETVAENTALMKPFIDNREKLQKRIQSAFAAIKHIDKADCDNVIAIGYCFGGLCVQDLARVNDQVKGIISVHGLMKKAPNLPQGKFNSKMLLLHGSDDPMVSENDWHELRDELNLAKCDWQKHDFGGVMHAFTNPLANEKSMGLKYNKLADKRSDYLIIDFIHECLGPNKIN